MKKEKTNNSHAKLFTPHTIFSENGKQMLHILLKLPYVCLLTLLGLLSLVNINAQNCPDSNNSYIILDYFNNETGNAQFTLYSAYTDLIYIDFGDYSDTTIINPGSVINLNHDYSVDNKNQSKYYVWAYFNPSDTNCDILYSNVEIPFQNKNCMIQVYASPDQTPLKVNFTFYTYNDIEDSMHVKVRYKNSEIDSFDLDYYSYHSLGYVFSKAGRDTIIVESLGSYCQSVDTVFFDIQGASCGQPTLTYSNTDSVNYIFTVENANNTSKYFWEISSNSLDSNFVTVYPSINIKLPYNEFVDVYVYSYDTINDCSSDWLYQEIVTGNLNCYASFSYNNFSDTVEFSNNSPEGKLYLWDFGDGDTSTEYSTVHIYKQSGVYTVMLTVFDLQQNCIQSSKRRITVGEVPCLADFSVMTEGNKVQFMNKSSGAQDVYWDFGDYSWSYDFSPTHTYAIPGIYDVWLNIWNNNSEAFCSDYVYKTITVGSLKELVYASFTYYTNDDTTFYFSDNSKGNIEKYYWTFGDGTTSTDKTPKKTYNNAGIYEVCLLVTNNMGKVSQYCEYVWAGNYNCTAQAKFSYQINNENAKEVTFIDQSNGQFSTYYWDFGDGTTGWSQSPIHTYENNGWYLVSLTVYDTASGCSDTYIDFIQIGTLDCRASFTYFVDESQKKVTLTNTSNASEGSYYYWYFDDGDYSELANPQPKVFDESGKHLISLVIFDPNTLCMDYAEEYVQVGDIECSAEFTYYVDVTNNTAKCINKSVGEATSYLWYFGDGSYAFEPNPTHQFQAPGYYTIGLLTYNNETGCYDYFENVVLIGRIGQDCEADFKYQISNETRTVRFSDKSKGTIVGYLWNFGNGQLSNESNPTVTYNKGGTYNVCLTVMNDKGITNLTCKDIKVAVDENSDCLARFAYTIDTISKKVTFISKSLGNPDTCTWSFGDGQSGDGKETSHTYNTNDYYLVSLSISTPAGCYSKAYKLINVGMPWGLKVAFDYEENIEKRKAGGYPIDFIGAGLGDQARIKWTFGDGTVDSSSTSPTHVFSEPGIYTVCYEVSDPITGATDTYCQEVQVGQVGIKSLLASELSIYPLPFNNELNISFNNRQVSGSWTIEITDLSGRKLMSTTKSELSTGYNLLRLNTSILKSGSYLLILRNGETKMTRLLVKQ